MNEIGSDNALTKENLPGSTPSLDWIPAACNYLTTRDLGPEWRTCIDLWVKLEEKLGSGMTKVASVFTRYAFSHDRTIRADYLPQSFAPENGPSGRQKAVRINAHTQLCLPFKAR